MSAFEQATGDPELAALAGLTSAADKVPVFTGSGTAELRTLLGKTTWSPSFTGSSSNPTLGTGGTITGWYEQVGKLVFVTVAIQFGSSGTGAGSGTYRVSLPVTPDATQSSWIGSVFSFDGTNGRVGICELDAANSRVQMWTDAATNRVAHNIPHSWGANHQLHLNFIYQAA